MHPALPASLILLLSACGPASTDDSVQPIDLSIEVVDPVNGEPVPDAWLAFDLGDELLSARSGADGSVFLPGLPGDAVLDVTIAAPGYTAVSFGEVELAQTELPWSLGLSLMDSADYDGRWVTVSGTIQGAPAGSWVLLYGARDYHDYVQGAGEEPVPFSFQAPLYGDEDSYTFSAVAIDDDYALQGVTVATALEDDAEDLVLIMEDGTLGSLQVEASVPMLNGRPASAPPADWCMQVLSTAPAEASGAVTGWNASCEQSGDGFLFTADFQPLEDMQQVATVYLTDDWEDFGNFSWAQVPVDGDSVTVAMLDTPVLDAATSFEPGASIGWQPAEGASSTMAYVQQGDDIPWLIYPGRDDGMDYPRLPEDFDSSLLPDSGSWTLYARDYSLDGDGALDISRPYRVSAVAGGEVSR